MGRDRHNETEILEMKKFGCICVFILLGMMMVDQVVGAGRSISWNVQDREVELESSLEMGAGSNNGGGDDDDDDDGPEGSIRFRMKAGLGEDLKVEFEFETENGMIETESELEFRPEVLVEYVDSDGDGALSTGEWRYNTTLKDAGWNTFVCNGPGVGASVKVYVCTVSHTALDLEFKFSVANIEVPAIVANASAIKPSMLKIDMALANFPYQVSASPSRLALIARVESKSSVEPSEDITGSTDVQEKVEFGSAARFSWVKQAMNGNATIPVLTSSFVRIDDDDDGDDIGEYDIIFSFAADNPSSIMWDPEVGSSDHPMGGVSSAFIALPTKWLLALGLTLALLFSLYG